MSFEGWKIIVTKLFKNSRSGHILLLTNPPRLDVRLRFDERVPGRVLLFKGTTMDTFSKPALPISDQIERLQNRGLIVSHPKKLEHYLTYN